MENFDIALRLKNLRKIAGITQEEFAEYANMSYKFYQHIESGRKKLVRIDTIERICAAYNIELRQFFDPNFCELKKFSTRKDVNSSVHYKNRKKTPKNP
ncbi:MAG: helix-turn-helix transcriptional regulator [Opitutales bacterium]|nr:helix-turn-helix transcriptional regulator [Opitutales bacterium]